MSLYAAQGGLQINFDFQQRVSACVTKETGAWAEKPTAPVSQIVADIIDNVAAAPGFAEKYLWGDQAAGVVPGQAAISDAEILGATQPLLEDYRPGVEPAAARSIGR